VSSLREDGSAVGSVTASDGTTIGYRSRGHGPGVLVVHGAMESSADYADLAEALAGSFTVHVLDRRGRGLSGPHGEGYGLPVEVDDVRAVLAATGARRIFGVSSGGVIALQAALELPDVSEVAAYEPAISVPGAQPDSGLVQRYEEEIARGQTAAAIVTVLKGLRVGPGFLRLLPRPVAVALMRKFVEQDEDTADDGVSVVSLVPTMRYDFQIADEGSVDLRRFTTLTRRVLLLGGSRSPRYLGAALTVLDDLLPDSRRVRLRGADHNTASNRKQGGRPDVVATELREFFAER
jgi:pimeloyl-ACP methyl ester carboxylesterase